MKLKQVFAPVAAAVLLTGAGVIIGCVPAPTGVSNTGNVPAKDTPMDEAFWNAYMPEYMVGMKATYETVEADLDADGKVVASTPSTSVHEVIKIENGIATIKTTEDGEDPTEATASLKPKFNADQAELKSQGAEDVTVKAGTYTGAAKFFTSNENEYGSSSQTVWLVSGIGHVKYEIVMKMSVEDQSFHKRITQELVSFTR